MRMKTLVFSGLMAVITFFHSPAFANNPTNNEKEPVRKGDSSEVVETRFEMSLDELKDVLTVELNGSFDQYSSVSVTNNRGSEFYFTFVQNGNNTLTFDLTTLEKGSYFLVLNTDKEIRIKRFVIN